MKLKSVKKIREGGGEKGENEKKEIELKLVVN